MSRRVRYAWVLSRLRDIGRGATKQPSAARLFPLRRRPRFESLEDRRLLSITVNTLVDENNGIGVGGISLREAIAAASAGETIDFSVAGVINLTHGELLINKNLTIAGPGANFLTIDASGNDPTPNSVLDDGDTTDDGDGSRVFNVDDGNSISDKTISISGLTLRGGDVGAATPRPGGAIRSLENLMLSDLTMTDNHSIGVLSNPTFRGGGAIYLATTTGTSLLSNLQIVGNSSLSEGGGMDIDATGTAHVTISDSRIVSNRSVDAGGGVSLSAHSGNPTIEVLRTSVINNTAIRIPNGGVIGGGGVAIFCDLSQNPLISIIDTTISGNATDGRGGGVSVSMQSSTGSVVIANSTVSGNQADESGGGIGVTSNPAGTIKVESSTIADNMLNVIPAAGATIAAGMDVGGTAIVQGSVLANNLAMSSDPTNPLPSDVGVTPNSTLTLSYSLVGVSNGAAIVDSGGNFIGTASSPINPLLGPLADNGGSTMTHALLVGSVAFNAGDPSIAFSPIDFDQRGTGYVRVSGGRIDMGAFELQVPGPALPGDYNLNTIVDAADYVLWRKTVGTTGVVAYAGADGDGDATVDQDDYGVWRAHFGQTLFGPVQTGDYNRDQAANAADYVVWRKTVGTNVGNYGGADGSGNGSVGPEDYAVWRAHFGQTAGAGSGEGEQASIESQESRTGTAVVSASVAVALAKPVAPVAAEQDVVEFGIAGHASNGTRASMDGGRGSGERTRVDEHPRDDALEARSDGRKDDVGETHGVGDGSGDGQDCLSYERALDDALTVLDEAFCAC